jgi:hypothetical protein
MIESSSGLTLLDPDHEVVVTGEEDHQDVLRAFAPIDRPRRVAAELRFAPLRRGRQAGQRGIEVLLDGRRIGELTQLMSVRYGGHVDAVLRRGERPGAVGLVRNGRRGLVEVELRLPDAESDVEPDATAAFPAPVPGRPSGGRGPRPVPHPPRPPRWRHRTPALVGGGVLALLLTVGAVAGAGAGQDERIPTVPVAAAPTTTARPTTTTPAPTTPAPAPEQADRDDDRVVAAGSAPEASRSAEPRTTARPAPQPAPRPAPRPAPEPDPRPAPQPDPAPRPAPDPEPTTRPAAEPEEDEPGPLAVSYRNCDAVRAAGAAPIRRGDPGYAAHLDREGDGVGCE